MMEASDSTNLFGEVGKSEYCKVIEFDFKKIFMVRNKVRPPLNYNNCFAFDLPRFEEV